MESNNVINEDERKVTGLNDFFLDGVLNMNIPEDNVTDPQADNISHSILQLI